MDKREFMKIKLLLNIKGIKQSQVERISERSYPTVKNVIETKTFDEYKTLVKQQKLIQKNRKNGSVKVNTKVYKLATPEDEYTSDHLVAMRENTKAIRELTKKL